MTLNERLKKVCGNCSKATINVYANSIKRLYKIENEKEVEISKKWILKQSLLDKHKKLPLKVRRHLSSGAVIFLKLFPKADNKKWYSRMINDSQEYKTQRGKNEKSDYEKKNWISDAMGKLKKASADYMRRNKNFIFEGEPNLKKLYKYQAYIAIRFISSIPFRNTLADFMIEDRKGKNYIHIPKKGNGELIVREHKNARKMGNVEVKMDRGLTTQMRKFLKFRAQVKIENKFLFNNLQGNKMSRNGFGKMLIKTTKLLLNKSIGSRLVRVFYATSKKDIIQQAEEVSNSLLHSAEQTKLYSRK